MPVRTFRITRWLFLANALINWTVSLPGIIDPSFAASMFGGVEPNYPTVIRLWQGLVFMFGIMFWEVSRDVSGKAPLIKYNWIEKTITATVITIGYVHGDIPQRLMLLIIFTNWLWIPFLVWADLAVKRVMKAHHSTVRQNTVRQNTESMDDLLKRAKSEQSQ